jgi:hypothetical protein
VEERIVVADPIADPKGYQRELLALLGDRDPADVMAATPAVVRDRTAGVAEELLHQRPEPNEWSVAELLGHLWDGEIAYSFRARLILAQDEPALIGYDQDAWANLARPSVYELIDSYVALRAANLALVRRTPAALRGRVGVHSERGRMSFDLLTQEIAGHDLAHTRQLEQTLALVLS